MNTDISTSSARVGLAASLENMKSNVLGRDERERVRVRARAREREEKRGERKRECVCVWCWKKRQDKVWQVTVDTSEGF